MVMERIQPQRDQQPLTGWTPFSFLLFTATKIYFNFASLSVAPVKKYCRQLQSVAASSIFLIDLREVWHLDEFD